MYHSIIIGEKNTWDDWHIVPTSRPTFSMPEIKTNYIDIPGADGVIDLTESLLKRPTYSNREGSFEFIVVNDYGEWSERYSEISNYLHGKAMKCYLEDDPGYYYQGRFSINGWKSEEKWSKITIDYSVEPYKYRKFNNQGWSYEPYVISRGVINNYRIFEVSGSETTIVTPRTMWIVPIITTTAGFSLLHEYGSVSHTYSLVRGSNIIEELILKPGNNRLTFTGNGTVTLDCRGGKL